MTTKPDLRRQVEQLREDRERFEKEANNLSQMIGRTRQRNEDLNSALADLERQHAENVKSLRELVRLHDLKEAADKEIRETSASSQVAAAFMEEYEEALPAAIATARGWLQDNDERTPLPPEDA